MHRLRTVLAFLGPVLVIGALIAFAYYSLALYKPKDLACGNVVERQADIAVHVIRQWAGKEGQDYTGCQATTQ